MDGRFIVSVPAETFGNQLSRDMGSGFKACVLAIGQPATKVVDILDIDESPDGSTVAEQESFAQSWFDSLGT